MQLTTSLKPQTQELQKLLILVQTKLFVSLFTTALLMRVGLALLFLLGIISRFFGEYNGDWLQIIAGVIILAFPLLIEFAFSIISLSTSISKNYLGNWTIAFYAISLFGFAYNAYLIGEYLDTVKDLKIRSFTFHVLHVINFLSFVLMELLGVLFLKVQQEEQSKPLPYQSQNEIHANATPRNASAESAIGAESADNLAIGKQRIAINHVLNFRNLNYNEFVANYGELCGFFELIKAGAKISWRQLDTMVNAAGQNGKLTKNLYEHYLTLSQKTETKVLVDANGYPIASQTTNITGGAL